MTAFLIKTLTSAVIIGLVSEIARRSPTYGGVIAALPLVSLISLIWLVRQGQSKMELMLFVKSVLYGLPATFLAVACVVPVIEPGRIVDFQRALRWSLLVDYLDAATTVGVVLESALVRMLIRVSLEENKASNASIVSSNDRTGS